MDEAAGTSELTAMLRSDGELVLRPILLTRIIGNGLEVDFPMLIDTGADDIVLPEMVALDFGLNLMDGSVVQR